jgi:hypothetical protein
MRKTDLIRALSQYDDDQEILVEATDGGFEDPIIYVSAVYARKSDELHSGVHSEYNQALDEKGFGAVVLGTPLGFAKLR